jgi:hypothetical protein
MFITKSLLNHLNNKINTFFVLKWGGKLELAKELMHYINVKRNV